MSELNTFLIKIREIQALMIKVSTVRDSIEANEEQYKILRNELRSFYLKYNIMDPNTFPTLDSFYLYWRSKLSTYQSRRDFISKMYEKVENIVVKKLEESMDLQIKEFDEYDINHTIESYFISDIYKDTSSNIFIFYANEDKIYADNIINKIKFIDPTFYYKTYDFGINDNIWDQLSFAKATSDYIFFIISKNAMLNKWFKKEHSYDTINKQNLIGINFISIIVDDVEIPKFFKQMENYKIDNYDINKLINKIKLIKNINFNNIDYNDFENLIMDLLKQLNYSNIKTITKFDKGYDIQADYIEKDPFGKEIKKTWLIETKFYKNDKPSLKSLRNIISIINESNDKIGLIITNGQLTSYAKNWLKRNKADIRTIEGNELKNILVQHPDIVNKYFITHKEI